VAAHAIGLDPNRVIGLREERLPARSCGPARPNPLVGFAATIRRSLQRIDGADAWMSLTASSAAVRLITLSEVLHRP
jgi:hypothetical protein